MSAFKKILNISKKIIFNKYILLLIVFGVYITFFDKHSLVSRWQVKQKIKALQKEYKFHEDEINKTKEEIRLLQTDSEYLEQFAREQYQMKAKDEDLFIIRE